MLFHDAAPSYEVVNLPGGTYEVRLVGQPDRCHALPMGLTAMPALLATGTWLVLCFAVWSAPDHESIELALDAASRFGEDRRLAVLPFERHHEIAAWCTAATETVGSPVWLLLRDGVLVSEHVGVLTAGDLDTLMETVS